MNRTIVACAWCMACIASGAALAQETDPPPAATSSVFDGFYAAAGGGTAVLRAHTAGRDSGASAHELGLSGGWGHTFSGSPFYFGVEAHSQFSVSTINANSAITSTPSSGTSGDLQIQRESQGAWGVSGRFGILATPVMMLYARGGYARAGLQRSELSPADPAGTQHDLDGYQYGLGSEAILTGALALRTEWIHTALGDIPGQEITDTMAMTSTVFPGTKPETNQFQLSLVWRFDAPDAAPATTTLDSGPYVGFGGGYEAGSRSENYSCSGADPAACTNDRIEVTSGNVDLAFTGQSGQVYAGYGIAAWKNYYFALEASYGRVLRDDRENKDSRGLQGHLDLQRELSGSLIVGRLLRQDMLAYLRLGYLYTRFDYQSGDLSAGDSLNGLILGVGTESTIHEGLFVRTEWQYLDYDDWHVPNTNANVTRHTLQNQDHYRFLISMGVRL